MKIALLLTGELRSFKSSYEFYKKYLFDKYNVDVFIHSWKFTVPKRFADEGTFAECVDLYKPKVCVEEEFNAEKEVGFIKQAESYTFKAGETISHNVLAMWYKWWKGNTIKLLYELNNDFVYDLVIRSRFDLFFNQDFPIENDYLDGALRFLKRHNAGGFCDIIAWGSSDLMNAYCTLYWQFDKYYQKGVKFHPETMLKEHIKEANIDVIRHDFDVSLARNWSSNGEPNICNIREYDES